MTVAEIANATNPVAAKLRRRNRRRSAMGAAAMPSSYTNPATATAAVTNRATIAGLAQPIALPRTRRDGPSARRQPGARRGRGGDVVVVGLGEFFTESRAGCPRCPGWRRDGAKLGFGLLGRGAHPGPGGVDHRGCCPGWDHA